MGMTFRGFLKKWRQPIFLMIILAIPMAESRQTLLYLRKPAFLAMVFIASAAWIFVLTRKSDMSKQVKYLVATCIVLDFISCAAVFGVNGITYFASISAVPGIMIPAMIDLGRHLKKGDGAGADRGLKFSRIAKSAAIPFVLVTIPSAVLGLFPQFWDYFGRPPFLVMSSVFGSAIAVSLMGVIPQSNIARSCCAFCLAADLVLCMFLYHALGLMYLLLFGLALGSTAKLILGLGRFLHSDDGVQAQ